MVVRHLPSRPSLDQLKLQARELRRDHGQGKRSASARIAAHHPRHAGANVDDVLNATLTLSDVQLVLAREYGFGSWSQLKHAVETSLRLSVFVTHPRFGEALADLDAGNAQSLRMRIAADPTLLHARTNLDAQHGYFAGATLLHHVAGNPWRDAALPSNVVEIARLLLEAGADVHAETLGRNGGTTLGLLVTSKQASDLGVTAALMDLLLAHGARLDVRSSTALHGSLTNHAPAAAEKMIALGATPDVVAAAALGQMDRLRSFFDDAGHLRERPRRHGRMMSERDAIGLALLHAYVREQPQAVDFLFEKDGNWDITGVNNGAVLHRAAYAGDLAMVERLVARGADMSNRDNPFNSTPLSWAQHNRQTEVFEWMRAHCAIDLHEAVCFDLREHVEARLREDPACINRRLDHWEIPQCTPLHWAAWLYYEDVAGTHAHDPVQRESLVTLLLDRGADPNIVAGNGCTALDIARSCAAEGIAALLERRGGRTADG